MMKQTMKKLVQEFKSQAGSYSKGFMFPHGEGLFTRGCSDRTRGNGCELKEGRFR